MPFGCSVMIHLRGGGRKFDPRATAGIVIGYAQGGAYLCMNLAPFLEENGKIQIFTSRDVRVDKRLFPLCAEDVQAKIRSIAPNLIAGDVDGVKNTTPDPIQPP